MKKNLIILSSLLLSLFYLSQAINLDLSSGDTLSSTSWQEIGSVTEKINLNSSNVNINGKLVSSGKICAGSKCLGECNSGFHWDISTSTCVSTGSTPETAGTSCLNIKQANSGAEDGVYYIDPNGGDKSDAFEVYCDMTNDGGGWTLAFKAASTYNFSSAENNKAALTDLYSANNGKLSDSTIQGLTTTRWRVTGVNNTYRLGDNQSRYLDASCKFGVNNKCRTTCGDYNMGLDCRTGDGYNSAIRSYCCVSSYSWARVTVRPNDSIYMRYPKGINGLKFNVNNSNENILIWVK